ncbi:uncharacterized protein LOC107468850 [Arachis duranensis]|uniref:Uncharacterized protein LOC107468850 n=1 Tax=Arachis duranensis TaxID=130453 RepID=A0A6P4BVB3_ARADU|nr:uncharacterized protein LOC107468850 [Arachis duranensis]
MVEFVVLRDSTTYNIILGRKMINDVEAVINTKLLVMKFVADDGSVGSIRGDLETAVACDNASLSLRKKSKEASGVFLADLDARVDDKPRPEPEGDLEKFRVGDTEEKFTHMTSLGRQAGHPSSGPKEKEDVPGESRGGGQVDGQPPRSRFYTRTRLLDLAVKCSSGKEAQWQMENVRGLFRPQQSMPQGLFSLPNIDALVDAAVGYRYLSFMDAYSGYNQIPMHQPDEDKTAFITPGGTYCYKVMPFGLKNARATYQRLMNKIFGSLIGKTVEVYVDNNLAKTTQPDDLLSYWWTKL